MPLKEVYIYIKTIRGKNKNKNRVVSLLLLKDDEGNQHYTLVKNISRLLSSETSKHDGKIHICMNCFNEFYTGNKLENHLEYCNNKMTRCY